MGAHIKVADEVWIACALLHYENPSSSDFSIAEIEKRAVKENIYGSLRPGIRWHINLHCVANKAPNPSKHRMLFEPRKGFRRLYCTGDEFHPDRSNGKKMPEENEIPLKYHYLLDWYIKWSETKLGSGSPIMPEAAIEKENYQSEIPETKPQTVNSATDFEKVAHKVMSNYYNTTFLRKKVKNVPKEFDFVSPNKNIIGDAKYYKLVRRYIIPYTIWQYQAYEVTRARERDVRLPLHRDLLVFRKE